MYVIQFFAQLIENKNTLASFSIHCTELCELCELWTMWTVNCELCELCELWTVNCELCELCELCIMWTVTCVNCVRHLMIPRKRNVIRSYATTPQFHNNGQIRQIRNPTSQCNQYWTLFSLTPNLTTIIGQSAKSSTTPQFNNDGQIRNRKSQCSFPNLTKLTSIQSAKGSTKTN